jgi:hypothetical protein
MSFEPPEGILDIGNATLRVGKLEVAETSGLNQGLLNIVKNNLLITENTEYAVNHKWGLKLPTTWVAEFEVKGHSGKYIEFNFYNEGFTSNTSGYTLNFNDTTLSLRYDNGSWTTATIPTIVDTYRKVNIFFERNVIAVSIDGTRVLYYKHAGNPPPVMSRVISTTGSAFVNVFIEENADNSKFKNLRIVNGRFISDQTSNIAFIGGNLGVGVNSPQETLDIRGNMHFNRVSNVSSVSVDSNVVTEYTGPHDRPLRKYPEVALTADAATASGYKGYIVNQSSFYEGSTDYAWKSFAGNQHWLSSGTAFDGGDDVFNDTNGPWISIQLPTKIKLEYLEFYTGSGRPGQTVAGGSVYASNDGSNWTNIGSLDNLGNYTDTAPAHVKFTHTTRYDRYLLHVTSVSLYTYAHIEKLSLYGHEEGSGSLDTTLKTVYNVPATTGTQLEVYYDAKDLTTMPSTVTDLSPNTNTGAVSGHSPTLDSTDGIDSFKFNGSSQYVTGAHGLTTGSDPVHTISLWLNAVELTDLDYVVQLGQGGTSHQQSAIIFKDNKIGHAHWGSGVLSEVTIANNVWYHVVAVFTGGNGSDLSKHKIFINGEDGGVGAFPGSTDGPVVLTGTQLTLGRNNNQGGTPGNYLKGSIANFRLFSKALNADQVKELYDYQKDYFLGSKSQVTLYKGHLGVGVTEPSGQLELAGDERIQEYPPRAFDGGQQQNVGPNEVYIEGHGHFKAWTTAEYGDGNRYYEAGSAFNKKSGQGTDDQDRWVSGQFWANGVNASTPGTGLPTASAPTFAGYKGAHLILELPYAINLKSFIIGASAATVNAYAIHVAQTPSVFVIIASNDGNNWDTIFNHTATPGVTTDYIDTVFSVNVTKAYSQYGYVALKNGNTSTDDHVTVGEWRLFGTPGPTTLDKGSLTLGRSLDVPRISRYDVDTETPRPEKIVLDFDTTKMYDAPGTGSRYSHIALDNSGLRRNGYFRGAIGNYYSRPDKAFKFIGDGYLQTDFYIMSGNPPMSQSIWFNYTGGSLETLYSITAGYGTNTTFWVYVDGDVLTVDFSGNAVTFTDPNTGSSAIGPDQWYHLVITYDGNSTIGGRRCYINGVEQVSSAVAGSNANGTLSLGSSRVTLGALDYSATTAAHFMVGYLSNFKIYDAILEPSEVRKLYRLGRTGRSMVISDTAVGIGREPEVQLDVRGTVRFDNAYIENIFSPSLLGHQTCFGGGSVSYNNSTYRLRWSSDIVIIPNHHTNGSGSMHCRIRCPENGEAINHYDLTGAHSTSAVTSAGIYLGVWQSLWYTVSDDGPVTSIPSQFFTMEYYSPRFPVLGTNSILIAVRFADGIDNELYFPSIRGRINVV